MKYHVNKPVSRSIWKDHEIIGECELSRKDADKLNSIKGIGVYFGYTDEEHKIINDGTEEELKEAGFIDY